MSSVPLVVLRDLSWSPPVEGAEPLFEGVDFAIDAGERVVLDGPSGSGKSTLLRCMVALERRDSGEISWKGKRIEPPEIRRFRRRVLYVHQEPADIAGSVAENLAFAREMGAKGVDRDPMSLDEQRELLAEFGLEELDVSRSFESLSVGERQRVALVRSFTPRPAVLLLDEPTTGLDAAATERVERFVDSYLERGERATVWVSHDAAQTERIATRTVDIRRFHPDS